MRCLLRDWNHFLVMNFQNDTKPFIRQIFAIWSIHQVVHLVTIDNDQSTTPVARKKYRKLYGEQMKHQPSMNA